MKGERVLVADQSETALLLESPQAFHAMLRDVIKKTEEALSTSVKDREEKRLLLEELPLQKAREAAQFVADNYDLLVIEPGLRSASFRFAGRVSYAIDASRASPSQRAPSRRPAASSCGGSRRRRPRRRAWRTTLRDRSARATRSTGTWCRFSRRCARIIAYPSVSRRSSAKSVRIRSRGAARRKTGCEVPWMIWWRASGRS